MNAQSRPGENLMTRVAPRFDTLAAARYAPPIADAGDDKKRTDLEKVFGENVRCVHA